MESKLILKGKKTLCWGGNTDIYRVTGKTDLMPDGQRQCKIHACPDWFYFRVLTKDSAVPPNFNIWMTSGDWARNCFAWGYNGKGPEMLAVCILRMYVNEPGNICSHGYVHHSGKELDVQLVVDNFKAFTADVVAKLPDEWTLTYEDISAWLKEKGINPHEPNVSEPISHS